MLQVNFNDCKAIRSYVLIKSRACLASPLFSRVPIIISFVFRSYSRSHSQVIVRVMRFYHIMNLRFTDLNAFNAWRTAVKRRPLNLY